MHIGLPKTGSTAVQHFLHDNRRALAGAGWVELSAFGLGNAWKIAAFSEAPNAFRYFSQQNKRISSSMGPRERDAFWNEVREEVSELPPETKVIASSEFIYGLCDDAPSLRVMQSRLAELFDKITVIAFVRDQVPALKSYFAQNVRGTFREGRPYSEFVRSFPVDHHLFNYEVGLGRWADIFGEDAVRPGIFDPRAQGGPRLIETFCDLIDLQGDVAHRLVRRGKPSNKTPGFRTIEVVRAVNRASASLPILGPAFKAARFIATRRPFDLGGDVPGTEDGYIRDTFGSSNISFGQRFFDVASDPFH